MIKNERQYRVARAEAEAFERTLVEVHANPRGSAPVPGVLREAEKEALRSQLESLRSEIAEYEALRSGRIRSFTLNSFAMLPGALIRARIARGLTQHDLAARLGLKEQQIQRYEATDYASASLNRVQQVIDALGLGVREEIWLAED